MFDRFTKIRHYKSMFIRNEARFQHSDIRDNFGKNICQMQHHVINFNFSNQEEIAEISIIQH